jgi:hypothetical protein
MVKTDYFSTIISVFHIYTAGWWGELCRAGGLATAAAALTARTVFLCTVQEKKTMHNGMPRHVEGTPDKG